LNPADQRLTASCFRAPDRVNVGTDISEAPQRQVRGEEVGGALHLAAPNHGVASFLAAGHDQQGTARRQQDGECDLEHTLDTARGDIPSTGRRCRKIALCERS
jgi:hypothetical protein